MIDRDDPIIKEWKNGIPFDENGKMLRGVRPTDEDIALALEWIETLDLEPDETSLKIERELLNCRDQNER